MLRNPFKKKTPLEHFQTRLLQMLALQMPPEKITEQLLQDKQLADYHAYIKEFDPAMIEIAEELVQKWSGR
ncbi:MAG: hypothetical protein HND56_07530 [Pseudomonadota bacterium]|nr:hypothetical protein [Pseudomonadota bacterium]QKK05542.1 MAG: hypothetical protein HND56_07530 [Pseudomonadota bacterium]